MQRGLPGDIRSAAGRGVALVVDDAGDDLSGEDGEHRHHLLDAGGEAEVLGADEFLVDADLRRTEERRLHGQGEEAAEGERHVPQQDGTANPAEDEQLGDRPSPSITSRFEKRSLSQPASGAKSTKGRAIMIVGPGFDRRKPIAPPSGTRMNCAALSLNAFCVCWTIMLQKPTHWRLVGSWSLGSSTASIRDDAMDGSRRPQCPGFEKPPPHDMGVVASKTAWGFAVHGEVDEVIALWMIEPAGKACRESRAALAAFAAGLGLFRGRVRSARHPSAGGRIPFC